MTEMNAGTGNVPARTQQGSEPTLAQQAQTWLQDPFTTFTQEAVNAMQKVSTLAERGPVIVLLVLGPMMIILALAFKIQVFDQAISTLSPAEFVTVILMGSLLVILGGLIRLYQYKLNQETARAIQMNVERALEAAVENSNKVVESELQKQQKVLDAQINSGQTPQLPDVKV